MNLRSDKRYTITREWCGYEKPQYVVRFCGEWIASHSTHGAALMRASCEAAAQGVAT
jgi:hypothetical protein